MTTLQLLSASVAALIASGAFAGSDVLWHVPLPQATFYGTEYSVVHDAPFPRDQEVADDFQATGLVERVEVPGRGCGQCGPAEVLGVYVRFYEWTANGPGALQHETFVGANSGNYEGSTTQPFEIAMNLDEPFLANGWHFISVQVAFANGGIWNFVQSNRFNNINAPIQFRDNLAGGVWAQHEDVTGNPSQSDFAITLIGQAGATQPNIAGVSRATVTGSDRVIVTGNDFGAPGDGRMLVAGIEALVMEWSSTQVIGYIPEGLTLGQADLVIENLGVPSAAFPINVVARDPDGRVDWVFEGSGSYISFPPTVGPDGRIYFSDVDGFLYAMSPDGALLWIVDALLGAQGSADEAPVQVDADGTIYVATNPLGPTVNLEAFNPDGTHRWSTVVPQAVTWQAGPTIGPDGRLYAATNGSQLLGQSYDVLAIGRDGVIDWTTAADPFVFEDASRGATMIFGSSSPGSPADQMIFTADRNGDGRNYGFDIEDGSQNFATPTAGGNDVGQGQLANRYGDGDFYMMEFNGIGGAGWGLQAFDRDGNRLWRFDPDIRSGATRPVVGPDGVIYIGWDLLRISAVDPGGDPIWTRIRATGMIDAVKPSPTAPILLTIGRLGFSEPSFAEVRHTSDGEVVWTQPLQDDVGAEVAVNTEIGLSPNGARMYFGASALPLTPTSVFRLFAVRVQDSVAVCDGDANGDNVVNFTDLNEALSAFGQSGEPGFTGADLNTDGVVDFADLNAVLSAFGVACG